MNHTPCETGVLKDSTAMPSNPEEMQTDPPDKKTGVLLVNEGFVRQEDVEIALEIQKREAEQTPCRTKVHPRTIGEILCDLNLITPIDLSAVLKKHSKYLKLGQILIMQGSIDEATLTIALKAAENGAEPIGKILLQQGIITETQLCEAYSLQHNLPFKPYDTFTPTPEDRATLSGIIGKDFARRYGILPVSLNQKRLGVVISDPEKLKIIEALRSKQTELRIECTFVTTGTFFRLFEHLYERKPFEPRPEPVKPALPRDHAATVSPTVSRAQRPSPSADEIVQFIFNKAIQSKAGTIHLSRDEAGATLNFPVQGKRTNAPPLWFEKRFREIAGEVIHRIKEMAGLNLDDRPRPKEGVIQTICQDQRTGKSIPVEFAVATCPTLEGELVTLTPVSQRRKAAGPVTPVFSETVRRQFYPLLKRGNGLILVTGPNGSPLAGAVHAALTHLQNPETPIVTLENPITYHLPGSIQVPASEGLPWETLFRSALKLGPDVMMIDRLKDAGTARSVFAVSRSGPLFISTLFAEDAVNALTHLRALGITPHQLAHGLGGILSLRPVRKLCDNCKAPYTPPASEWTRLFSESPDHLRFYRKTGCRDCHFSGYSGQIVLSELMPVTGPLLNAISGDASEEALRWIAIGQGMHTLIQDGLDRIEDTTIETLLADIPMAGIAALKSKHRRETPASRGKTVYTEVFSNPKAQREAVIRLHAAYERLAITRGLRAGPSDPHLFNRFILHHFQLISQRYHCRQVSFGIVDRQKRIIITAMPVQASDESLTH
ncbi:MAG: ATPase, T2SS/T4P/T4SS family [Pseudomonadota bacterium]